MSEPRAALVNALMTLFRDKGYDGVSIGDISAATGLGRSSLYHHFPGGKEEMARAVLDHARGAIGAFVLAPLRAEGSAADRVAGMLDGARALYRGEPCVLASLLNNAAGGPLSAGLREAFEAWLDALTDVLREAGHAPQAAAERASAALALVQGGLVLTRALGDAKHFEAALAQARAVCEA